MAKSREIPLGYGAPLTAEWFSTRINCTNERSTPNFVLMVCVRVSISPCALSKSSPIHLKIYGVSLCHTINSHRAQNLKSTNTPYPPPKLLFKFKKMKWWIRKWTIILHYSKIYIKWWWLSSFIPCFSFLFDVSG